MTELYVYVLIERFAGSLDFDDHIWKNVRVTFNMKEAQQWRASSGRDFRRDYEYYKVAMPYDIITS